MINFTRYNNSKATWPIPVCLQASLSLNSSDGEIKTFAEQRFFLTFSAFILKHRTKQQFINNSSIHRLHESDFEQNTLINRMTLFFSDNSIAFAFTDVSRKKKKGKSLISTAYLTNIRLHSRFLRDVHSTPSLRSKRFLARFV